MKTRFVAAIILMVAATTVLSQDAGIARFLIPGPTSILIEVGKWIARDRDPIYEVKVRGIGRTDIEAREQAFRLAVQEAIGALIFSQVQIQQGEVRRHEILNYSSGYVDRFEVLRQGQDAQGRITIDMKVWVRRSTIADGLFGSSTKDQAVDGSRAAAGVQTMRQERKDSDAMLKAVLRDFPGKVFVITVTKTAWSMDQSRHSNLVLDFTVEWHNPWINSLHQLLKEVNGVSSDHACMTRPWDCERANFSYIVLRLRPGAQQITAWHDATKYNILHENLIDRGLMLRVDLETSQGRNLRRDCIYPQQVASDPPLGQWLNLMSPMYQQGIEVFAYSKIKGRITLRNIPDAVIKDVEKAQISVVKSQNCQ